MLKDKDSEKVAQSVRDYLDWIDSLAYTDSDIRKRYTLVLSDFVSFVRNKDGLKTGPFSAELSEYLVGNGKTKASKTRTQKILLPDIYQDYLLHQEQNLQVSSSYLRQTRRVLILFHEYLERYRIQLCSLKIEHLDAFMAEFKVSENALRVYRYYLRGFLKYLYHERGVIKKDFAPLLVGPRLFAKEKPPKFLRPTEVQKLFSSLKLSTPADIRTYAMVHLAYFLGLRPVEISRITFDDISFSKGELSLPKRKADNPITLPVPERVFKAIAAYIIKARPKSPNRHLFLSLHFPYRPMNSGTVVCYLSRAMKRAGLSSSGYWLRHTYAQNLLQIGRSIYEIKEMLGHDHIESTGVYLHIHIELMRKVLFNETL
jgi:site-specific recombinase XerD